ncbi:hypothetical protein QTP88_028450 [Uroleucon formosanum]
MSSATNRQNILQLIRNRELNDSNRIKYALKSNLNDKCISNLGLFAQLKEKKFRVSCLQWNESGSTLASASDNFKVILWDPFLQKVKTSIKTLHRDRIYSVKFIPGCNDDVVATGAGDGSLHTYNVTTGKQLSNCICFQGQIIRGAVANDSPSVYWCASEEGYISQHDMRISHKCPNDKYKTVLVAIYDKIGNMGKAKCLDINQLKTEQLAVGANDQYVRLYDRRMIQWVSSFAENYTFLNGSKDNNYEVNNALQYFVPSHIGSDDYETYFHRNCVTDYLTFSPDGQELLVNYRYDYVYLYNLANPSDNAFLNICNMMKVPRENGEGLSTDLIDDQIPVLHLTQPDNIVQLNLKANYLLEREDYSAAIVLYNEAINIHNNCELFLNRAEAYINREWLGDFYAAFKDCVTALKLEPNLMKAHIRLAECLFHMDKVDESKMYLDQLIMKYPSYKPSSAYKSLYSDLLNAQPNDKKALHGRKLLIDHERLFYKQTQMKKFEKYFRTHAKDYHRRYYGHCNYLTNTKEAKFFGSRNQFIVAGSDDGHIFVWEKNTENNLLILKGDSRVVNCIQPHPSEFLLATSGMNHKIKLWSPLPDGMDNPFKMNDYNTKAELNQRVMCGKSFVENQKLWVSIDETTDANGHYVANVIIGTLEVGNIGKMFLLNSEVLEKNNHSTIAKVLDKSLSILWPQEIIHDNVLLFLSDAAPYMHITKSITQLETFGGPLIDSINIIQKIKAEIQKAPNQIRKIIYQKLTSTLNKNKGFKIISDISDTLNGQGATNEILDELTANDLAFFKYSPITSVDVERSFSIYKNLLATKDHFYLNI